MSRKRWSLARWLLAGTLLFIIGVVAFFWMWGIPPWPADVTGRITLVQDRATEHLYPGGKQLYRITPAGAPLDRDVGGGMRLAVEGTVLIWLHPGARVRHQGGGRTELAMGQTVRAWCSGPQLTSFPPQWGAYFVLIESDGP
jgi:hypothetical protein